MNTNVIWKTKTFNELSTSELYQIIKARIEVFTVEQKCYYQDLDEMDKKAIHLWVEHDGKLIAYSRLFDKNIIHTEASFGRVLTPISERGKNYGKLLVKKSIEVIENKFKAKEIRISAQDYLIKFYEEFGFKSTQKKYVEVGIPHTEMLKT